MYEPYRATGIVLPEGSESLEVDGLQDVFGGIELQQQHDEDAMVGQLLELRLPYVMVLDQHSYHDTQHLETSIQPSVNTTTHFIYTPLYSATGLAVN